MIDAKDPKLSVSNQCRLLKLNRSTYYYKKKPVKTEDLELMRLIDEQYPMSRGFMCLVAVMDWHSRKVLSWRISNTLDTEFCVEAVEEALGRYGTPEIFNTDQGAQFTSNEFTELLKSHQVLDNLTPDEVYTAKVPRKGRGRPKKRPARVIGDKAYDSDPLRKRCKELKIDLIVPHRRNRKKSKKRR